MTFNPIRRSDRGEYNVVIENNHDIIPNDQRRVEARFSVVVSIPPVKPTHLNVNALSDRSATLSWSISSNNNDESADNQTITVYYHTSGMVAYKMVVGGEVRQVMLSLIPGVRYTTTVATENVDGVTVSENRTFQTLTGGRYSTHE
jgi:hypothetical protein